MLGQWTRKEEDWRPRPFRNSCILDARDYGMPFAGEGSLEGLKFFEGVFETREGDRAFLRIMLNTEFIYSGETHLSAWCWLSHDDSIEINVDVVAAPFFLAAVIGMEDLQMAIRDLVIYLEQIIQEMGDRGFFWEVVPTSDQVEKRIEEPLLSRAEKYFRSTKFTSVPDAEKFLLKGGSPNLVGRQDWVSCWYKDGCHYEGQLHNNEYHGQGKFTFPSGDIYEGDFRKGVRSGSGRYSYLKGGFYIGEWENGKRHGRGKEVAPDGSVYEGEWKDDKYHGKGRLSFNGVSYDGGWEDGMKHGHGKYVWANGAQFIGTHVHDERVSGQILYDGRLFEGTLRTEFNDNSTRLVVSMQKEQKAVFEFGYDNFKLRLIS